MLKRAIDRTITFTAPVHISTGGKELHAKQDYRKKDFLTKAYLASGCKASDTAFVHSSSFGVSLKKKASLLRSSS